MIDVPHATVRGSQRVARNVARLTLAAVLGAMLAACGGGKEDKPTTQTAARVNKEEITVHQINFMLEQQRAIPPALAASASRQALSRLIDQELAMQEAKNLKVDRDPRVVRQLEAARREIIARAYVERIGSTIARPSASEIKDFYDNKPELFSQRRVYTLEEVTIEAQPEQMGALKAALAGAKDADAFGELLRAQGIRYARKRAVTAAEQLPIDRLADFADMKEGQTIFNPSPVGAQVLFMLGSQSQPVELDRARPAIEQFLLNERRTKAIQDDLAALRAAAKIEYVGEFAGMGDAAPAADLAPVATPFAPGASGVPAR